MRALFSNSVEFVDVLDFKGCALEMTRNRNFHDSINPHGYFVDSEGLVKTPCACRKASRRDCDKYFLRSPPYPSACRKVTPRKCVKSY
jgi:hypothetical protein